MEEEKKKRGRPKKATQEQLDFIDDGIQKLGLGDSLSDFARQMSEDGKTQMFARSLAQQIEASQALSDQMAHNGSIQPVLSQNLFRKLSYNPLVATSEDIERWVMNPQANARNLRNVSTYLSFAVGQYNRAIWYFNTIKAYNYELVPCDSFEESDKKEYMESYQNCLDTLKKMNIKFQFPKIDLSVMYNGVGTYWITETTDSYQFVQLPNDWIYLTAPNAYGMYSATMDLTYFDQYVGLQQSIPELWEAYQYFVRLRKNGLDGKKLSDDQLTVVQYFPLPVDKCFTISFNPAMPEATPPLTSSMGSALDVLSYKKLLKDQAALSLFSVISCKIPLDKVTNKMTLSYQEASSITAIIQSNLPDNIRVVTSPFDSEKMAIDQSGRMDDILKLGNQGFSSSAGIQEGNFGGNDLRQAGAMDISTRVDFIYASQHMYTQFANIVNIILSHKSKKFKFMVQFFGNAMRKDEEIKMYGEQMATRNGSASRYWASQGYEPFQILPMLNLESELGIKDKMKPLSSMFQATKTGGGTAGRKKLDTDDLSDSGSDSREYQ